MMRPRFLLAGCVAAALSAHLQASPTVHLSPTGHDDNAGTEAEPYLTLAKAIEEVDPGGTVIAESGTYIVQAEDGAPNGAAAIVIDKPLTLRGADPQAPAVFEFQDLPGTSVIPELGIRLSASNVIIENVEFELEVSGNDSIMISIPSGPAPNYPIIHHDISFNNVNFNGARWALFSHAGNLYVENSTFINQIRTMSCDFVVRNCAFIGIPAVNDRQAIIVEGFGDLPGISGTILIEGNTIVNRNQAFLFSQWNPGGEIEFHFRHNTVDSLLNRGIIFYIGGLQDPGAFSRFRKIEISDNIFNDVARMVYLDYSGGGDPELKPVPADGQIFLNNNTGSGLATPPSTETTNDGNRASFRNDATPSAATTAMFLDINGSADIPDYDNPGAVADGDVSLDPSSPFIGASTTMATIGAWQAIPFADEISVVGDPSEIPSEPVGVYSASLGEALLAVNTGGRLNLASPIIYSPGLPVTKAVELNGLPGVGGTTIVDNGQGTVLTVLSTANDVRFNGLAFRSPNSAPTGLEFRGGCSLAALVEACTFGGYGRAITIEGAADVTIESSTFLGSEVADIQTTDEIIAVNVHGNLFFGQNIHAATDESDPSGTAPGFHGNWYADEYDEDTDQTGTITGLVKTVSLPSSPQGVDDSSVVAQLDRSVNGLADAIVLLGGGDFSGLTSFDSTGSGVPDGAETHLGLDGSGYQAIANEDEDGNGVADWYDLSLGVYSEAHGGHPSLLGRVNRGPAVGLGDAIRALQLVNGAVPFDHELADLNAVNVTGQGPRVLANPLQILRHQAGVRVLFPAVAGID